MKYKHISLYWNRSGLLSEAKSRKLEQFNHFVLTVIPKYFFVESGSCRMKSRFIWANQLRIGIFIFFLLGNLFAQQADFNISKMKYGQERQFISARMLGLGGSGVAGGDAFSALYLNPALAGKTQKWLSINGGLIINKSEEDRSFPYYDSFGGFEDYGSFSFNKNWRPALYGNIIVQIPIEFVKDAALAFGYQPFMGRLWTLIITT
jgi:hypothetical protein